MKVFLSGEYKKDCNADNPLGLGGKLARAYGGLMEKLWQVGVCVSRVVVLFSFGSTHPEFSRTHLVDEASIIIVFT